MTAGWGGKAPIKIRPGYHRCPGKGCTIVVSNKLLACPKHWGQLSAPVKAAVLATKRHNVLHPERRQALADAMEEWHGER